MSLRSGSYSRCTVSPHSPAGARLQAFALALGLCTACAASPLLPPPTDLDAAILWRAQYEDLAADSYEQLLEDNGWQALGSVEGERYRQSFHLRRGRRGQLYQQVAGWLAEQPDNPDLAYLQARLLADPERLLATFEGLVRRWPGHAWIRLGAAGSNQNLSQWGRASRHLRAAPEWPDAAEFAHLLAARQAAAEQREEPWLSLLEDAFESHAPAALEEVARLARAADNLPLAQRAMAELALHNARSADLDQQRDALLQRLVAELRAHPEAGLDTLLVQLERWSAILELPQDWTASPRLRLPWGLAEVLRPEPGSSAALDGLSASGHWLLLGRSALNGLELLVLDQAEAVQMEWPGAASPIWIVACASVRSPQPNPMLGGAVFRGFYVRRDLTARIAETLDYAVARLDPATPAWVAADALPPTPPSHGEELAEDWELALHLRAAALGDGEAARELEWRALLMHESGHLPDTLPLIEGRASWLRAGWMAWQSWWRDGMALGEWEYRAQLRALASGHAARWNLAHVLDAAADPTAPYHRPYRRLLKDLYRLAAAQGWPPAARWRARSDRQIAELAQALAASRGVELLPADACLQLLEKMSPLDQDAGATPPLADQESAGAQHPLD